MVKSRKPTSKDPEKPTPEEPVPTLESTRAHMPVLREATSLDTSDLDTWCQQLGFSGGYASGSVVFGTRSCAAPTNGKLFGCSTGTDVGIWHWCDSQDVDWKDATLDSHTCSVADRITSITCTP